jgi:hypothetical protein
VRVVQVLGTNGSGKSTLFRSFAESDPTAVVTPGGTSPLTFVPQVRGVFVGDYLSGKKTPGVDGIHGKVDILAALDVALSEAKHYHFSWVGWEGIIIMTRQYHQEILARGGDPLYLVLDTPEDECFARIARRSGKVREALKQNGAIVTNRMRGVVSLAKWLQEQPGAYVWQLDGCRSPWLNGTMLLRMLGVQAVRTPV